MIMKNYVADELSNKVYHLNLALQKARDIIKTLEEENKTLTDAFNSLASLNNSQSCARVKESMDEPIY